MVAKEVEEQPFQLAEGSASKMLVEVGAACSGEVAGTAEEAVVGMFEEVAAAAPAKAVVAQTFALEGRHRHLVEVVVGMQLVAEEQIHLQKGVEELEYP